MDAFFLQSGIGGPGGLHSQHIAILDHFLSIQKNTKSNIMFYLFILITSSNKVTFSIMI